MSHAAQKLRGNESGRRYRTENPEIDIQTLSRKKITKGEKTLWCLGVVTIFILCLTIVSNQASIYNATRQIDQIQGTLDQTTSTNSGLKTQVTQLSTPARIMNYAKEKLGMTINVNNIKEVK